MTTTRQGVLLVMAWLVLALLLAFPAQALVASTSGVAAPSPATPVHAAGAHDEHEPPCHHDRTSGGERPAAEPHHDHASGTHHTSGGCCPMSLCVGTCGSVCSGAGVGAVLSGVLLPSLDGDGERVPVRLRTDVSSGTLGTPYRPPIGKPARAG